MHNLSLLVAIIIVTGFSSCKKCYKCVNECVSCSITVNSNVFTHTLCTDSFDTQAAYNAAIAADTGLGYTCLASSPTYEYEFCSTKEGEEQYLNYFNRGNRLKCTEK